jgi:tetraacyldisaccharide 4'-kinase
LVVYLARRLPNAGILTRGYRRQSREKYLLLEKGARAPAEQTGDEPQIFLRAGAAPVGIGTDRWETGRRLEERFGVRTILLDDGFQHLRLQRQVNIVCVDGLDPLGGSETFPLGRLREPLSALARATIFVITRSDRPMLGVERQLRKHNQRAPVFYARVAPECWVEVATGNRIPAGDLPFTRVAAFCGLANPASFWRTLRSLGIRPEPRLTFGDHHRYEKGELRKLFGADAVLTTEKDVANLSFPVPNLYWLEIRIEVNDEERFLAEIQRQMA